MNELWENRERHEEIREGMRENEIQNKSEKETAGKKIKWHE